MALVHGRRCCMDLGCGRSCPSPSPSPGCGSGDTDGDQASQLQHAVERMDGDVHLGRPTPVRARVQPVTDDLLERADGCFGPSPLCVAARLLPGRASVLGDTVQVAVPLRGFGLGRVARHGRGPWRHDDRRLGMALGHGGGNALLVVGAVGGEGGDASGDLVEQGVDRGTVVDLLCNQRRSDTLAGVVIQADVQLAPGPARLGAVFLNQALAGGSAWSGPAQSERVRTGG